MADPTRIPVSVTVDKCKTVKANGWIQARVRVTWDPLLLEMEMDGYTYGRAGPTRGPTVATIEVEGERWHRQDRLTATNIEIEYR
jgi:hypothetical protein